MNQTSKFSVRDICYAGLFAAVIAVMAQISIPMPLGVPMTMQTFAITLAAVVLGSKLSAIATLVYLLLGAVGVPVLANFSGGIDKFVGPTGGFPDLLPPSWPTSSAWAWSTAMPLRARSLWPLSWAPWSTISSV